MVPADGQTTEVGGQYGRLAVVIFCILLAVLVIWALVGDRPASYAAQMRTRGLAIEFVDQLRSPWLVKRAQICVRNEARPAGVAGLSAVDGPVCDPALYWVHEVLQAELLWPAGTRLQIARTAHDAPLEIDVLEAGERLLTTGDLELPRHSRIIIANEDWQREATLTLEGEVTVGDTPGSGSAYNVIEGSFAVSEAMLGYDKPVEVYSAPLRSGDVVQVLEEFSDETPGNTRPVKVLGFIEPAEKDVSGFKATIYSPYGKAVLRIDRYGAVGTKIVPDELDRAIKSPAILALAGFFAVISLVTGLLRIVTWIWGPQPWPGLSALRRFLWR